MRTKITISFIKAIPLRVKAKFFPLSKDESESLNEYGFKSSYEADVYDVLKKKWHDTSWFFAMAVTILTSSCLIKNILR